jgi:50S ribosomal subunit-associated GTPase HflX
MPEGREQFPFWRALHPDALPISAKSGQGLDKLVEAVFEHARGKSVTAVLEMDVTSGKLISKIESRTRVLDRKFIKGDRVRIKTIVGRSLLAELARDEDLVIRSAREEDQ